MGGLSFEQAPRPRHGAEMLGFQCMKRGERMVGNNSETDMLGGFELALWSEGCWEGLGR